MEQLTYTVRDGAVIGVNEDGHEFTRTAACLGPWGMKSLEDLEEWLLKHGYTRIPSKLESLKAACCAEQPAHVSHVEPERAELPQIAKPAYFVHDANPALLRMSAERDHTHGSAYLKPQD